MPIARVRSPGGGPPPQSVRHASDLPPLISNAGSLATLVAMRRGSSAKSRPAAFRRRRPLRRRGVLHREGSRRAKARVIRSIIQGLRSSPQRLNGSSIKGCPSFDSDQLGRSPLWRSKGGRPNVVRVKIDAAVLTSARMRKCGWWAIVDRLSIDGQAGRGDRPRQPSFPRPNLANARRHSVREVANCLIVMRA